MASRGNTYKPVGSGLTEAGAVSSPTSGTIVRPGNQGGRVQDTVPLRERPLAELVKPALWLTRACGDNCEAGFASPESFLRGPGGSTVAECVDQAFENQLPVGIA